jgi:zinc protease
MIARPPVTPELPPFALPRCLEARLDNGLEVLAVPDDRLPLVHLRLGFPAGTKFDPPELRGLSETTAFLLTQGTAHRSAREIAERVAELGASLAAHSGADSLVLEGNVLSENFDAFLELVADVTRNPIFPEDEIALRKQNRKQELLAQRSLADFLAQEKTAELVFGPHPYARQEPTPESMDRLDRSAIAGFAERHLAPAGGVLVLVGDLPPFDELLDRLNRYLGDWSRSPTPTGEAVSPPPPARSITLVDRPGSVQVDLRIGRLAVTRTDPDYFPLLLATTVLGGGASSRLFTDIREKRGYAYDAHSALTAYREAGIVEVVTQIRNEVLADALAALLEHMERIGREPVSTEELETARNYLCGVFVIRLETLHGLASQLAATRLLGLQLDYLEQYMSRVRAPDAGQLQAAAARYLDPGNAVIVAVGDAARVGHALEHFGPVQYEKAP